MIVIQVLTSAAFFSSALLILLAILFNIGCVVLRLAGLEEISFAQGVLCGLFLIMITISLGWCTYVLL